MSVVAEAGMIQALPSGLEAIVYSLSLQGVRGGAGLRGGVYNATVSAGFPEGTMPAFGDYYYVAGDQELALKELFEVGIQHDRYAQFLTGMQFTREAQPVAVHGHVYGHETPDAVLRAEAEKFHSVPNPGLRQATLLGHAVAGRFVHMLQAHSSIQSQALREAFAACRPHVAGKLAV